jgi:hypothetical protein
MTDRVVVSREIGNLNIILNPKREYDAAVTLAVMTLLPFIVFHKNFWNAWEGIPTLDKYGNPQNLFLCSTLLVITLACTSYMFFWLFLVKEHLSLSSRELKIWKSAFGHNFKLRSFRIADIRNFRPIVTKTRGKGGVTSNTSVEFDYRNETKTFFFRISDADAVNICELLNKSNEKHAN